MATTTDDGWERVEPAPPIVRNEIERALTEAGTLWFYCDILPRITLYVHVCEPVAMPDAPMDQRANDLLPQLIAETEKALARLKEIACDG